MKATKLMKTSPSVISFAAIGGKKENEGPLGDYFDKINDDPYFSTDSFEKGESQLQKQAVLHALDKAALSPEDIDVLFGGDLLNQCVGTTYGVRAFEMPFLGIYGACSTMAEGLLLASLFVDNDLAKKQWRSHPPTSAPLKDSTAFPSTTVDSVLPHLSGQPQPQAHWWLPPRTSPPTSGAVLSEK